MGSKGKRLEAEESSYWGLGLLLSQNEAAFHVNLDKKHVFHSGEGQKGEIYRHSHPSFIGTAFIEDSLNTTLQPISYLATVNIEYMLLILFPILIPPA